MDVPAVRNIVFFRYLESAIVFHQMVGRGTRIDEASGKLMLTAPLELIRAHETELLSPRQREILQHIAEGLSSKEIAQKLKLRPKTVDTHRTALMRRLDIHDVAGLVRYAIREGLITP